MVDAVVWWVTLEILGLIALPIAGVLLRGLPDRGYSAAKILGILLVGWLAYTLAMLKLAAFGPILLLVCAAIVIILSIFLLFRDGRSLLADLGAHYRKTTTWRYIATAEVLFTVAFAVWAWTRAYNPVISGTEQYMDFGFMNSILKSGVFPPNDPWLAGESINYYYFGYVLMSGLISLSGLRSEVAYQLAISTLFALTALGSFGVVWNLISGTLARRYARVRAPRRVVAEPEADPEPVLETAAASELVISPTLPVRRSRAARTSATATIESVETVEAVEVAEPKAPIEEVEEAEDQPIQVDPDEQADSGRRARRTIEAPLSSGSAYEPAEDIEADPRRYPVYLSPYPYALLAAIMMVLMGNLTTMFTDKPANADTMEGNGFRFCFNCNTAQGFDWWAPSRLIQDYRTTTVNGETQKTKVGYEGINEFPAFSFLLGDVHAHVLALPLVLLAVAGALAFTRRKVLRATTWRDGVPQSLGAWLALLLSGLVAGSLYVTNTWDYPTYLLLLLGGLGLPYIAAQRRANREEWAWDWAKPFAVQASILVASSLILFLPFHLTFKSLVGGGNVQVSENIANIPLLGWLAERIGSLILVNTANKTILGFIVIFGTFLAVLIVWLGFELVSYMRRQVQIGEEPVRVLAPWAGILVGFLIAAFLLKFPLLALLAPLVAVALFLIVQEPQRVERNFALLMFAGAALIGLVIEVVFLRDNFQMRMNTLFKFEYQIWLLFALAAGYGLWRALHEAFAVRRGGETAPVALKALAGVWALVVLFLALSGTLYSVYGVQSRQIQGRTAPQGLDGTTWIQNEQPSDYAALQWLKVYGKGTDTVLEAGRDEYGRPGRVSAFTGVPTLLAWDTSHESLWRTNQPELLDQISQRRRVIDSLYQGVDPTTSAPLTADTMLDLLHQYNVNYVFVGAVERGKPGWAPGQANEIMTSYAEGLFNQALPVAFRSGDTFIFSVLDTIAGTGIPPTTPVPGETPGATGNVPDPNVAPANLFERGAASANFGRFNLPRTIARDGAGNFYVADTQNLRIEKFDKDGNYLLAFGSKGNGPGQFAPLSDEAEGTGPSGIAVDAAGNVYVADTWNHRVQKFDSEGNFIVAWGSFISLGDPSTEGDADKDSRFYGPRGIAVGPDVNVYVTDTGNKRVLIFGADGSYQRQISSGMSPTRVAPDYPFNAPGELNEPIGIAVDAAGNVYVADVNNNRIQKFDNAGSPVAQWPLPSGVWAPGPYLEPFLALDGAGNLYATAPSAKLVLKLSPTGEVAAQKGSEGDANLQLPTGITVDTDGTIYVVDTGANAVIEFGKMP